MAESKVADRLSWLVGKDVTVRCIDSESASGLWEFSAVYRDTLPMGREYFLVFSLPSNPPATRMIRASSVVELRTSETYPAAGGA